MIVGHETYGRAKKVGGTAIVTQFYMFQMLPILPRQSLYFLGSGPRKSTGIPLIACETESAVIGIPLARLCPASVVLAYLRAALAVPVVAGFVALLMLVIGRSDPTTTQSGLVVLRALSWCFVFSTIGGLLTYAIPLTSPRERAIRTWCGQLLGVCVDPALVIPDAAKSMGRYSRTATSLDAANQQHLELLRELVATRALIAIGWDRKPQERRTDQLLQQLAHYGS